MCSHSNTNSCQTEISRQNLHYTCIKSIRIKCSQKGTCTQFLKLAHKIANSNRNQRCTGCSSFFPREMSKACFVAVAKEWLHLRKWSLEWFGGWSMQRCQSIHSLNHNKDHQLSSILRHHWLSYVMRKAMCSNLHQEQWMNSCLSECMLRRAQELKWVDRKGFPKDIEHSK